MTSQTKSRYIIYHFPSLLEIGDERYMLGSLPVNRTLPSVSALSYWIELCEKQSRVVSPASHCNVPHMWLRAVKYCVQSFALALFPIGQKLGSHSHLQRLFSQLLAICICLYLLCLVFCIKSFSYVISWRLSLFGAKEKINKTITNVL